MGLGFPDGFILAIGFDGYGPYLPQPGQCPRDIGLIYVNLDI